MLIAKPDPTQAKRDKFPNPLFIDVLSPATGCQKPRVVRRARVLEENHIERILRYIAENSNAALSDNVKFLLSTRAGLRAGEIAGLTRDAVVNADGQLSDRIIVGKHIAKMRHERIVPIHPQLREALLRFCKAHPTLEFFAYSKRRYTIKRQTVDATKKWFARLYEANGLEGCSSHSGRRTFITSLARSANNYGRSLRDIQLIAGHTRLESTAAYIDPTENLADLVAALGSAPVKRADVNEGGDQ